MFTWSVKVNVRWDIFCDFQTPWICTNNCSYADPIELKKEMEEGRVTPPYGTEATQSSERRNSNLSYSSTRSRDRTRRQIRNGKSGLLCCTAAKAVKRNYY